MLNPTQVVYKQYNGVLDQVQQSSLRLDPQFFEPPIKEEQPDVEPETTSSLQAVFGGLGSEQAPPSPTMPRTASEQPTGSCSPLSSAQVPLHPTIRLPCDSPRTLRLKKKYK
ncbi:uncharacterized protein LOC124632923 isoform X2 [Helicoverpa zea]|uniref:uncharacterized protein LOC124632923 isoform X2 n=1 Tax=Helicoverpa zea TaxID=7113 RepID=UPI001F588990|nr:uncharacterized protein LOC124632923 isoform X2 [Helicoverpa zea]XP_047023893.1 uncharacterized protein LOC124632923 isoform X2 [Helicoverpa zea]